MKGTFIVSVRNTAIAIALAASALPAAYAQSGSVFVGGEAGWIDLPVQSSLTREQVREEFLQFRKNPVGPDGGRFVGGEAGYIMPQPKPDSPKPDPVMTPAERKRFQELYPA